MDSAIRQRAARRVAAVCAMAALLAACGTAPHAPTSAAEVGELHHGPAVVKGFLNGYLTPEELPNSLALLPAPPEPGSAAMADDIAAFKTLTAFINGPRGVQAARDADLNFPAAADAFSCALNIRIAEQTTPNIAMLLRRTLTDAGLATSSAKSQYQRTRPFVTMDAPTCTPEDAVKLRNNGSYPSGHASAGWAWALTLAEVAPDRAPPIFERGRSFGQSRAVCGMHWKSDVEAGRLVGAATVARLHGNAVYRAQLAAARGEYQRARAAGQTPGAQACAAENAVLRSTSKLAP